MPQRLAASFKSFSGGGKCRLHGRSGVQAIARTQVREICDAFTVMVKSRNAARRVMASLIRYCEGQLQLVVNRAKSRAAPLKSSAFLSYRLNNRAKVAWTEKARIRFKQRVREITSRDRGHRVKDIIDELNLYVRGVAQLLQAQLHVQ